MGLLTELRRVVRSSGRIGLLVIVARTSAPDDQRQGNNFPTANSLAGLVQRAGLRVEERHGTSDLPPIPMDWQSRVETVNAKLRDRHGHERAWQLAEHQADLVARLLADSCVSGELLSLRRD